MLTFDGVETAFYVWLNGTFVGFGEDSFTPSHFDITDHLNEGNNRLAVQVFQRSTASWIEDQDFGVPLVFSVMSGSSSSHVCMLKICSSKPNSMMTIHRAILQLDLQLSGQTTGACVDVTLTDATGKQVASVLGQKAKPEMVLCLAVDAPDL